MTPAEKAVYDEAKAASQMLPEGLEDESALVARVVYRGRHPYVELNGQLREPLVNVCTVGDPYNESGIVRCAEAGFKIIQLNLRMDNYFKGDNTASDFSAVDTLVRRLLHLVPDAYVIFSLRFMMRQWAIDNPNEWVRYGAGSVDLEATDEFRERVVRPSAASESFRTLVLKMIREFGQYVDAQPWDKRILGIRPSYGVYSEWCCYGFNDAPDTGQRMQEKFRAYELAKRGISNAEVPTMAMRRHDYSDASKPNLNSDLLDPSQDQLVLDYYECLANTMADLLLAMASQARQSFPGRLIGAYYGYMFASDPPEGTTVLLDKVLSDPNIDFLSNPPYYQSQTRRAGGSYAPRTIVSTFRRYGKLSLLEDDSRFHHIRDWLQTANDGLAQASESALETQMNMRRNWLNQFFDGDCIQINDPITSSGKRPHAFDDPNVFTAIAEAKTALAQAGEPAAQSGNNIAVIFSGRERLRMDGGKCSYFTWNLYKTTFMYLHRSGAAFDLMTLEDYLADPGDYKILLFLNAFYLTDEERATLVSRTRQSGITAIWFGPAGGVTDSGFNDSLMSQLTGITATGIARRPQIVCKDSAATSICAGWAYSKTLSGGARSIIVPEIATSYTGGANGYAALLREAGAWLYTDTGSYFRRHGDVYMFHTGTNGTHTIRLPENVSRVKELFSGQEYASSTLSVTSDGPSTWLFRATTLGPWTVGASVTASLTSDGVLSFTGSGAMDDFTSAADAPWDPAVVSSVSVGEGVSLGANALSSLSDATTYKGTSLGELRGALGGSVPEGMVAVSKTELEAAGAVTLTIADNTVQLGISVCTNADLTASTANWGAVKFKKSELDVSADGAQIIAPIPVNAKQGFMVLRSEGREK